MIQAKFNLEDSHIHFWGNARLADSRARARPCAAPVAIYAMNIEEQRSLQESAALYAEAYEEDAELRALTDSSVADWPV